MFGATETLISFLQRQLGVRTDSSSGTGSVHSKLGDLKDTVNTNFSTVNTALARTPWMAGKKVYIQYGRYQNTVSANITVDMFELTGPILILGGYVDLGTTSQYAYYTLVADGANIFNVSGSTANGSNGIVEYYNTTNNDVTSTSHGSNAYFLPNPYHSSVTFSTKAQFTIPPMFYCDTNFKLSVRSGSSNSTPNPKWAVYYIRMV
ncbi:hypothetical protein [Heliophilum fasciatum]|uniref:Uncharacterized protein n=1 Tax=Heliophilum fasciatum TaxID=35700 RepID=A0A4R2RTQ0_9FIRM|nr:hypothetical protein [Heliophilum fasciatum]MCW2278746.1 hypothetical protein [Heliophilum fasciatum]TCP62515.1 hypothetical protein EDD73_12113 [Heliophilum fasciatum]